MIALAFGPPLPEPPDPPKGPRPTALVLLDHALDLVEKRPRGGEMDAYDRELVLESVGMVPFRESIPWLRGIARSEGADAFAWAEVVRAAGESSVFCLFETEACSNEEWESLPATPAGCLAWVEGLVEFHEALATEEADLMECNWNIADDLRAIARTLRRMGYKPSLVDLPESIRDRLPGWYADYEYEDDE